MFYTLLHKYSHRYFFLLFLSSPLERPALLLKGAELPRAEVNVPTTPEQVLAEQTKRCQVLGERNWLMTDKLARETLLLRPLLEERGIGASRFVMHARACTALALPRMLHTLPCNLGEQ